MSVLKVNLPNRPIKCDRCNHLNSFEGEIVPIEPECKNCGAAIHYHSEIRPVIQPKPKPTFGVKEVMVGIVLWIAISLFWGNYVGFSSHEGPEFCDVSFCR